MILWRVSNYETLDGAGGLYVSGRWHTKGHPVVYFTRNPATALLETLVHIEIDAEDRPERVQILKIEGADSLSLERIEVNRLPAGWLTDWPLTQEIGDDWLAGKRTLLLEVPCVLVPETFNLLVNPLHSEAPQLKIVALYEHPLDARFLR
jgi:RES domain-containing protein